LGHRFGLQTQTIPLDTVGLAPCRRTLEDKERRSSGRSLRCQVQLRTTHQNSSGRLSNSTAPQESPSRRHRVCGLPAHAWQHVGVGVEGDGNGSVPEDLLHETNIVAPFRASMGSPVLSEGASRRHNPRGVPSDDRRSLQRRWTGGLLARIPVAGDCGFRCSRTCSGTRTRLLGWCVERRAR
jgi:hypothetical protein